MNDLLLCQLQPSLLGVTGAAVLVPLALPLHLSHLSITHLSVVAAFGLHCVISMPFLPNSFHCNGLAQDRWLLIH